MYSLAAASIMPAGQCSHRQHACGSYYYSYYYSGPWSEREGLRLAAAAAAEHAAVIGLPRRLRAGNPAQPGAGVMRDVPRVSGAGE
jgi:hypothetical protein